MLAAYGTNTIGVVRATQAALSLREKSDNPVVVNLGSSPRSFWAVTSPERDESHYPNLAYSASKAAVSMLTVHYAKALPKIRCNAVEHGFTATDLTASAGSGRPVQESVEIIVRMATIGQNGPTGTFQESTGELTWSSPHHR